MRIIGSSITSPAVVVDYLDSQNCSYGIFPINFSLGNQDTREFALSKDILLILTYSDYKSNIKLLNNYRLAGKTLILFSPVVRFTSMLDVIMLDIENLEIMLDHPYKFKDPDLKSITATSKEVVLETSNDHYLPLLVETALTGSLLTHLMTFIYKIPNTKTQNIYKHKIILWFVSGDSKLSTIKEIISTILPVEVREGILNVIKLAKKYKEVFEHIAILQKERKHISFSKISNMFDVSEFDLRYMTSIAAKLKEASDKTKVVAPLKYYTNGKNNDLN